MQMVLPLGIRRPLAVLRLIEQRETGGTETTKTLKIMILFLSVGRWGSPGRTTLAVHRLIEQREIGGTEKTKTLSIMILFLERKGKGEPASCFGSWMVFPLVNNEREVVQTRHKPSTY